MRNIRQRDTLLYAFSCGISFFIVGWIWVQWYPVRRPWLLEAILFFAGVADVYILESTQDIYRLSRMKVIGNWLIRSLLGLLITGFIIIAGSQASFNFKLFVDHWGVLFLIPVLVKLMVLTWSSHRLKSGKVYYNTVLIGSGSKAIQALKELKDKLPSQGQYFIGTISDQPVEGLNPLGDMDQLQEVLDTGTIDEAIVALEHDQHDLLINILHHLRSMRRDLMIRITPDSYDFLMGRIKMDAVYGAPLIELPRGRMRLWQLSLKRIADLFFAITLLILLSPLILFICIKTLLSSPGPLLYSQSRIGRFGTPFNIFKFRSMYTEAESQGPQLSFDGDHRCTPWGAFMRKWRLDEIPQFINVLKGEMSIVGPRPEREFFINQIKKVAPYYSRILTIRPGITSWGQVKYGYASDIDQMVERLKFDLIYVENQSLTLDIKIICYTILVLFQGKGK